MSAVNYQHGSGFAGRGDDAAVLHKLGHHGLVERPERIAGGGLVVPGLKRAALVALGNEHQWSVVGHDFIEEDRDVHGARLGHAVVALPGAVVLMPLPDLTIEGRLGVDFELMHV